MLLAGRPRRWRADRRIAAMHTAAYLENSPSIYFIKTAGFFTSKMLKKGQPTGIYSNASFALESPAFASYLFQNLHRRKVNSSVMV